MDITKWEDTWAKIDWENDTEDDIKQKITELYEVGVDFNMANERNGSMRPLMYATRYSSPAVVELLIDGGADVTLIDRYGHTALHLAASNGKTENLKHLIKYGPQKNIDAQDSDLNTALCLAAANGYKEMAEELIEAGADVNARSEGGWTPLHSAAKNKYVEVAKVLIDAGADVNAADDECRSVLHTAVRQNCPEMVQVLIDAGADINAKNSRGYTPIELAEGEATKTLLLIAAGEDIKNKDINGWSLLHYAARDDHPIVVEKLIEAGADVNAQKGDGWTPLMLAAYNNNSDVVKILINAGAEINAQGEHKRTALREATQKGAVKTIEVLIDAGADVNMQDEYDETALHSAAENCYIDVVKALTDAGADVNIQDNRGNTPLLSIVSELDLLEKKVKRLSYHEKIAEILISHGANFDIKNNEGKTVRDYGGRTSAVIMLQIMEAEADRAKKQQKTSLQETLNEASEQTGNDNLLKKGISAIKGVFKKER